MVRICQCENDYLSAGLSTSSFALFISSLASFTPSLKLFTPLPKHTHQFRNFLAAKQQQNNQCDDNPLGTAGQEAQ